MHKSGIVVALTATVLVGAAGRVVGASMGGDEAPSSAPAALAPEPALKAAPAATTTPEKTTKLYFVPTDQDASATVLNVYNTTAVDHLVYLRGYCAGAGLCYSLNVNIPKGTLMHLASDSIVSAPPPSWDPTKYVVVTNFTDFVGWAYIAMPKGVDVDGYTLFNPGTGVVDPRADQGEIPLRFTTDGKYSKKLP